MCIRNKNGQKFSLKITQKLISILNFLLKRWKCLHTYSLSVLVGTKVLVVNLRTNTHTQRHKSMVHEYQVFGWNVRKFIEEFARIWSHAVFCIILQFIILKTLIQKRLHQVSMSLLNFWIQEDYKWKFESCISSWFWEKSMKRNTDHCASTSLLY